MLCLHKSQKIFLSQDVGMLFLFVIRILKRFFSP